jgi:hypothetical protein
MTEPPNIDEAPTNIFYLSKCAFTSAEWMHEKHTVKMITESAQMLSTAVQLMIVETDSRLYKPAYAFHPCTIWITKSVWHYEWLMRHYEALSQKYSKHFNREHRAYFKLISILREYYYLFPRESWIDPPQCMPEKYRQANTEEAYRAYYVNEKVKGRCYYKFAPPFWIPMSLVIKARPKEVIEDDENALETDP